MFRQASLFGSDDPFFDASFSSAARSQLSAASWVEYVPGWLGGSDALFDDVMDTVEFTQRRNLPMYDRLVDEPRLSSWWSETSHDVVPVPILADIRWALAERYGRHFDSIGFNLYRDQRDSVAWHADRHRTVVTEPVIAILADIRWALAERYGRHFDSIGFNLYRDQRDSVAWHADRHRTVVTEPVIAILSVGESRPFQMRRMRDDEHGEEGGASLTWGLGHGDLLVMGGACQHEWQHCVPKRRRPTGPRLSITYRHDAR